MKKKIAGLLTILMCTGMIIGRDCAMAADRMEISQKNIGSLYGEANPVKIEQEPEISAVMQKFIYADVSEQVHFTQVQQELLKLAVLVSSNITEDLETYIAGALQSGATVAEVRETIYQCTPYVGFPRVKEALEKMHDVFESKGIKVPLADNGTVDDSNRYDKGLAVQVGIFGDAIYKMNSSAPADQKHINTYLSANCFGDYYTRQVLDLRQRELITFIAIASLGCCEPQLKAHAAANIAVGNTRQDLLDAVTVALPYIGYPRTLNALGCINEIVPAK